MWYLKGDFMSKSINELTKNLFADTIKELMKSKPLSKIRVSEVCKECGLDRTTFYNHFKDKYDLVAWIFLKTVLNSLKNTNGVIGINESAKVLNDMKKDLKFYKNAYSDTSQNSLSEYIQNYNVNMYIEIVKEYLNTDVLTQEQIYEIQFFCYGGLGMTRAWIMNNAQVDALYYAEIMHKNMPQFLKEVILKKDN